MALVEATFPGGRKVEARIAGFSIPTDQSEKNDGEGSAPEPFQLFLAAVATCAGFYAKSFCDKRDLGAPERLELNIERGDDGLLSRLELVLTVDPEFPEKYDGAIARSMDLCAVKKQLHEGIETSIRIARKANLTA